jgi:hypothetical protein
MEGSLFQFFSVRTTPNVDALLATLYCMYDTFAN